MVQQILKRATNKGFIFGSLQEIFSQAGMFDKPWIWQRLPNKKIANCKLQICIDVPWLTKIKNT